MSETPQKPAPQPPATPQATPKKDGKLQESGEAIAEFGGSVAEFGGAKGPEPTRYGDWEHKGRCTDF